LLLKVLWDKECDIVDARDQLGLGEFHQQAREASKVISSHNGLGQVNEEVVNPSLVSLLMAITMKHPNVHATWTPQRASLTARFRKSAVVSMLDGFLYSNLTSQTQVILEAKARRREYHAPNVFWQEAAELVAALHTPPLGGCEGAVSQDGDRLYIAMAVRNDRYQEFLLDINEPDNGEGFPLIRQWGPWNINRSNDVK
ncbi:uncharacterized protein N7515_007446, partial [Penicillium bovifimosum]